MTIMQTPIANSTTIHARHGFPWNHTVLRENYTGVPRKFHGRFPLGVARAGLTDRRTDRDPRTEQAMPTEQLQRIKLKCHISCICRLAGQLNKTADTQTRPFNGPFPGTTRVSWYQKGKNNLDFTEEAVSGSGISWAICKSAPCSRQITTLAPHHSVFTGRMPFLPPNQQHQSTEGQNKTVDSGSLYLAPRPTS